MTRKKVLIIVDNLGGGGAQKQIFLLAKNFKDHNISLSILTYHQYTDDVYGGPLRELGIRITSLHLPKYYLRLLKVRAFVRKAKPDIILSFLGGANILSSLVKLSLIKGPKLFVSERRGLTDVYSFRDRFKYNLYRFAANKVVPNSIDIENKIRNRAPWLERKLSLIWNMVEKPHSNDTEKANNKRAEHFKVIVGASYQRLKNAHNFIQATGELIRKYNLNPEEIRVEWYGNKMKNTNQEYLQMLQSLVLKNNLTNTFYLNDFTGSLVKRVRDADFVALPSFFEGCPNFIVEGMYMKKPVLISDVCSNRHIVGNNGGYFFDPDNIQDITKALIAAYHTTAKERMEMGESNHRRARELFDIDQKISQFRDLFQNHS